MKDNPQDVLFIRRSPRDRGKPLSEQDKQAIEEFKDFLRTHGKANPKIMKILAEEQAKIGETPREKGI